MTADTLTPKTPDVPIVVEIDDGECWWIFTDTAAAIQHIRDARAKGRRASIVHPVASYRTGCAS